MKAVGILLLCCSGVQLFPSPIDGSLDVTKWNRDNYRRHYVDGFTNSHDTRAQHGGRRDYGIGNNLGGLGAFTNAETRNRHRVSANLGGHVSVLGARGTGSVGAEWNNRRDGKGFNLGGGVEAKAQVEVVPGAIGF